MLWTILTLQSEARVSPTSHQLGYLLILFKTGWVVTSLGELILQEIWAIYPRVWDTIPPLIGFLLSLCNTVPFPVPVAVTKLDLVFTSLKLVPIWIVPYTDLALFPAEFSGVTHYVLLIVISWAFSSFQFWRLYMEEWWRRCLRRQLFSVPEAEIMLGKHRATAPQPQPERCFRLKQCPPVALCFCLSSSLVQRAKKIWKKHLS